MNNKTIGLFFLINLIGIEVVAGPCCSKCLADSPRPSRVTPVLVLGESSASIDSTERPGTPADIDIARQVGYALDELLQENAPYQDLIKPEIIVKLFDQLAFGHREDSCGSYVDSGMYTSVQIKKKTQLEINKMVRRFDEFPELRHSHAMHLVVAKTRRVGEREIVKIFAEMVLRGSESK